MAFSTRPPMWMATPSGSCVETRGAEQLVCEIPAAAFKADGAWALEAMIYLKDFAGWSYPGNPILLGVEQDNDAWVGWRQETWEKARLPKFGAAGVAAVAPDKFKDFPRERWCQVRVAYDGKGRATLTVDGEKWGEVSGVKMKAGKAARVTVGPFKGSVDEVRLIQGL
jgi:hypothetical protein